MSPAGRVFDTDELLEAADHLRDLEETLPRVKKTLDALEAAMVDTRRGRFLSLEIAGMLHRCGASQAETFFVLADRLRVLLDSHPDPEAAWGAFERTVSVFSHEAAAARREGKR